MKYLSFANRISSNKQPEFLMVLIDLSPSMDENDWKPSRRAGAIRANIELLKLKAQHYPQDIVGIIGFGGQAELLHCPAMFNNGIYGISESIENACVPCGTNFTAALKLAENCFSSTNDLSKSTSASKGLLRALTGIFCEPTPNTRGKSRANGRTTKRIIMLTDGEHNGYTCPEKVADRLKGAGIVIDCIGIGGTPKDVDEARLERIASQNHDGSIRYCFIGDQQKLLRKYQTLAHHIRAI